MEKAIKTIRQIVTILVVASFITAAGVLMTYRDKQVMEAADKYEECVAKTYHTTPSAWYAEYNEYPVCK